MQKIELRFWMGGPQLAKLIAAGQGFWNLVESWARWPLTQLDPLTCTEGMLKLIAYQRDIQRFKDEPIDLYRRRVHFALINNQDAGSKIGFIRIFERLGIGYVEIDERVDEVNWDVILLRLSDSQIAQNIPLLQSIIQKYGRTCRRYQFETIAPLVVGACIFGRSTCAAYSYSIAKL